jgi:hypothetical protein
MKPAVCADIVDPWDAIGTRCKQPSLYVYVVFGVLRSLARKLEALAGCATALPSPTLTLDMRQTSKTQTPA